MYSITLTKFQQLVQRAIRMVMVKNFTQQTKYVRFLQMLSFFLLMFIA